MLVTDFSSKAQKTASSTLQMAEVKSMFREVLPKQGMPHKRLGLGLLESYKGWTVWPS